MKNKINFIKTIYLFFFISMFSAVGFGQTIEATTEDGRKVILKPDKTWEFAESETTETKPVDKDRVGYTRAGIATRIGTGISGETTTAPPTYTARGTDSTLRTAEGISGGGILNGKATALPKPPYSPAARAVRASGAVNVQVTIGYEGKVIEAKAVSGHPLLRQASEKAAMEAIFEPTLLDGQPVMLTGIIVYNFVP